MADAPEPFDPPDPPAENPTAVADWRAASAAVAARQEATAQRRAALLASGEGRSA